MSNLKSYNTRSMSKKNSNFDKKVKPKKSSCKKLLFFDPVATESNGLIEESILQEICKLSPLSPIKRSSRNIDPLANSCCNLSSPIRSLSLNSPQQNKTIAKSPKKNFYSPRKRVLNESGIINQTAPLTSAENHFKNKQEPSTPLSKCKSNKILNDFSFSSPKKRSKFNSFKDTSTKNLDENKDLMPNILLSQIKIDKASDVLLDQNQMESDSLQKSSKKTDSNLSNIFKNETKLNEKSLLPRKKEMLKGCLSGSLTAVKQALHNSIPDILIGRDIEKKEISKFIENHGKSKVSASLYISGAPGTGKSACLTEVLAHIKTCKHIESAILINCMALQTAAKVYQRVAKELGAKTNQTKLFRLASNYIENVLVKKGSMILLVLDEMDQLDSKNQEVLYMMFGWTSLKNSRLILVGIANSLNLTDRILPRLQAEGRLKPTVINFKPYNKEELLRILQSRVQASKKNSSEVADIFDSAALQFCARKVASTTGDARKALDICRRAIEMLEVKNSSKKDTKDPVSPNVNLLQISRIISGVENSSSISSSDDNSDSDSSFPLQQKLLVCALVLLCKKTKRKEAPLGKLHEFYVEICAKRQVSFVNQSEFFALCELVQSHGIITLKKTKQLRQSQVKLNIQESEVEFALKEKALLSSILQNEL